MKVSFTANFAVFTRFLGGFSSRLEKILSDKNEPLKYRLWAIFDLKSVQQFWDKIKYAKKCHQKKNYKY